jgi:methionine-rich copper-binding protein CopC
VSCFIRVVLLILIPGLLVLGGCGGSSSSTKGPAADFTLTATPPALSLTGGAPGQSVSVTATATNGFAGQVTLSVSGLPSGVTASPASLTVSPGAAQNITLTASASVATAVSTVTLTGTSGTLSHTASIALSTTAAVAPPDFSLTLTPSSLTLVPGTAGTPVSMLASGVNGFTSPVAVTIIGLPSGVTASPASLTLIPGAAQNVTLSATQGAALGASTVTFTGTSGALTHAASLTLTVQAAPIADVTSYHYDNARDGLNAQETILTPANVTSATFGKIGFFAADGKVDAQPLYLAGLSVNGTTTNVVYMASEHDSVYAINADRGTVIWQVSLFGAGESTSEAVGGCGQISPEIGITSTPVIDRAKGAIFVVGMTKDSAKQYHQRLHALSLTTGAELPGSPVEISGSYPGTGANSSGGRVVFDPKQYAERAALLLLNGRLYLTWTSHCDQGAYTGWVMAYDENTLQQTAILNLTPNGSDGSVWMSGNGMAADAAGNIYFLDANGTFDGSFDSHGFPAQQDYGNAIIKLSTATGLSVADFFEPFNTVNESSHDVDMGSGGALLLPDLTDASGAVRHLLVGAGKDTHIYVADRDNLGKFNPTANSNIYQDISGAISQGAWSSPAYFNNTVYYGGRDDTLKAFAIGNAKLATAPSSASAVTFPYPGATPTVSANGTQNAIVWAAETPSGGAGVLHAYDATNLTKELYNSNQAAGGRDSFTGNKFITPVVVDGKVLVGTPTGVVVFGLLP